MSPAGDQAENSIGGSAGETLPSTSTSTSTSYYSARSGDSSSTYHSAVSQLASTGTNSRPGRGSGSSR